MMSYSFLVGLSKEQFIELLNSYISQLGDLTMIDRVLIVSSMIQKLFKSYSKFEKLFVRQPFFLVDVCAKTS